MRTLNVFNECGLNDKLTTKMSNNILPTVLVIDVNSVSFIDYKRERESRKYKVRE